MAFTFAAAKELIEREANFYRIHLIFFTFVPLILSGIFYAANGEYHIPYIDCLFLCYSALTVTGLSTVNLSTCTGFQQALLFIQMALGNITTVSWIMVLIRKRYFRKHCEMIMREYQKKHRMRKVWNSLGKRSFRRTMSQVPDVKLKGPTGEEKQMSPEEPVVAASEGIVAALVGGAGVGIGVGLGHKPFQDGILDGRVNPIMETLQPDGKHSGQGIVADAHSFTSSPRSVVVSIRPVSPAYGDRNLGVELDERKLQHTRPDRNYMRKRATRQFTMVTQSTAVSGPPMRKDQDMGGFPGPVELSRRLIRTNAFGFIDRIWNRIVAHWQTRYQSWLPEGIDGLIIGRNSEFNTDDLTDEELESLGGIEYRALRFLSYFVFAYFVAFNLIPMIIIIPWLQTRSTYDEVFANQPRLVPKAWFTAFQIIGAYTGGGMSLVDAGMVPFQKAYVMIFLMILAILAGNHGLPIFLRFIIWICTKVVPENSHADQALHFLLDHPRRCFIYLFPSHVTWFLLVTLISFTGIEWTSFKVLNIGLPALEALAPGDQAVAGLFQSFAVRASGFPIISIAALAPSFQFLCVVMMYIAVFPVAMSIRSTNVFVPPLISESLTSDIVLRHRYEERSLGVFEAPPEDEDEEPAMKEGGSRGERVGRYFHWHLRRQVGFDIWWLVWGIFFVCIIERGKLMDDANAPWFNLFRIIFEMVSAFGGIGLTLGIPTDNFAFSGAFGPLSKLIVCIIMLRGRHRGLPVAIDRAILLPSELIPNKTAEAGAAQTPEAPQNIEVQTMSGPPNQKVTPTSVV